METALVVLILWLLALSVGTAAFLLTRRRSSVVTRYERQRCIHCGYDVRASPSECPECGSPLIEQSVKYWEARVSESKP